MPALSKAGGYTEAMNGMADEMMPKPPAPDDEESGDKPKDDPDALITAIEAKLSRLRSLLPGVSMDEDEDDETEM